MKKVKNYIEPGLAKKKIARYKYWSIKDESGITICTSEENNPDKKSFAEVLRQIMKDNVDVEVQIRYGTSDQSSRQNPPLFIKINEQIEWVEPEEETVSINGIPHQVDKNGNVNINLTTPKVQEQPRVEKAVPIDTLRQEIDMRVHGLRREYEIKEEKWKIEMQNKLMEQTIKFRELMLVDREAQLSAREQKITEKENNLDEKQKEMQGDVVGYLKQVPRALGAIIKEFTKSDNDSLGKTKEEKPKPVRKPAEFTIEDDEEPIADEVFTDEQIDEEIAKYEQEENLSENEVIEEQEQITEEIDEDYEQEEIPPEEDIEFTSSSDEIDN